MNRFVDNMNKLLYIRYAEEKTAEHETRQVKSENCTTCLCGFKFELHN